MTPPHLRQSSGPRLSPKSAPAPPPVPPPAGPPMPPMKGPMRMPSPVQSPSPSSGDGRNSLLSSIQAGTSLRKTVTNDRSAPVLGSGGSKPAPRQPPMTPPNSRATCPQTPPKVFSPKNLVPSRPAPPPPPHLHNIPPQHISPNKASEMSNGFPAPPPPPSSNRAPAPPPPAMDPPPPPRRGSGAPQRNSLHGMPPPPPMSNGDAGAPAPPPPPRKEPADWESRFNFRTDIPQPQMYMPMPKTYPSKDATMKGRSTRRKHRERGGIPNNMTNSTRPLPPAPGRGPPAPAPPPSNRGPPASPSGRGPSSIGSRAPPPPNSRAPSLPRGGPPPIPRSQPPPPPSRVNPPPPPPPR
ncbi:hypothetical protein ACHWQZ_G018870 [Mnemiopsis leidyi]